MTDPEKTEDVEEGLEKLVRGAQGKYAEDENGPEHYACVVRSEISDLRERLEEVEEERDPMDDHDCEEVADFSRFMEGEREWWFGRLTEEVDGFPNETWCCHIKTPVKEVVFGFNRHDLEYFPAMSLAVLEEAVNDEWTRRIAEKALRAADRPVHADEPEGDEVRQKVQAACDCDPGEEVDALERMIDYYDGMQAWIEHHFGKIVDEIVLEEPYHEPDPKVLLASDESVSGEGELPTTVDTGRMRREAGDDTDEPVSREGEENRVTSVARSHYAVDRLDECLKEIRSDDPNLARVDHMICAAMGTGLKVNRSPQREGHAELRDATHADTRSGLPPAYFRMAAKAIEAKADEGWYRNEALARQVAHAFRRLSDAPSGEEERDG